MLSHRRVISVVLIAFSLVTLPATIARALLLTISGNARTPAGYAVSGATVTDGSHVTTTDGVGHYSIQETQFGNYTLTASKAGMVSETKSTTLSATNSNVILDFTLVATSTSTVASSYLSAANGAATLTYTLTTYASNPGTSGQAGKSCAFVTDSRNGQTSAMTYQNQLGSQFIWSWTTSIAQGASEGTYTLLGKVKDCSSSTQLDTGTTATYLIDNTLPRLYAYLPQDLGNCFAPCNHFLVIVRDAGGSGIDGQTGRLTVTQGATTLINNVQMTMASDGTSVAFTYDSSIFSVGNYHAHFSSKDRAGNELALDYDYLVNTIVGGIPLTTAKIDDTDSDSLTVNGGITLTRFPSVLVSVDGYPLTLSGSLHPGHGYLTQQVPFSAAQVTYTLSTGQTQTVLASTFTSPQTNPLGPREVDQMLAIPDTEASPLAANVSSYLGTLGTVKLNIPGTVISATLSMPSVSTQLVPGVYPRVQSVLPIGYDICQTIQCPSNVDITPVFSKVAPARSLVEANETALAKALELFGTPPVGVSIAPVHWVMHCTEVSDDGHPASCDKVVGTPDLPDGTSLCWKLNCGPPPPDRSSGPDFTPHDFSNLCGKRLPCAAQESPIQPVAMSADNEYDCPNGTCQDGNHWMDLGAAHAYTNAYNDNYYCSGNTDQGKCEILLLWSAFGHDGYDSGKQDSHQAGFAGDSSNDLYYLNYSGRFYWTDYKGEATTACDAGPGDEEYFPYTTGVGKYVHQDNGAAINHKFGQIYSSGDCIWIARGGAVYGFYLLRHPGDYSGTRQKPAQTEYDIVKKNRNCSLTFGGISFGGGPSPKPPWIIPSFQVNWNNECNESTDTTIFHYSGPYNY